jgi:hypothetical protein
MSVLGITVAFWVFGGGAAVFYSFSVPVLVKDLTVIWKESRLTTTFQNLQVRTRLASMHGLRV